MACVSFCFGYFSRVLNAAGQRLLWMPTFVGMTVPTVIQS